MMTIVSLRDVFLALPPLLAFSPRTGCGSRPLPRYPQAIRLGQGGPRRRVAARGALERRTRRYPFGAADQTLRRRGAAIVPGGRGGSISSQCRVWGALSALGPALFTFECVAAVRNHMDGAEYCVCHHRHRHIPYSSASPARCIAHLRVLSYWALLLRSTWDVAVVPRCMIGSRILV